MLDINERMKAKFPYLSDDKLQEIISQGKIIALGAGEVYLHTGERTRKVGVVLNGLMRNYIMRENGQEVTVAFASEMQPVAPYTSIFLNQPSGETSKAVEHSLLFSLDFDVFKNKIDSDPYYTRVYADIVQESLVAAIARIEDFAKKSPEQRYHRLLETNSILVDRVPLKYLASYIGITPVSLSRIRKRKATSRNAA
jgi:CRP-like cAMP-binding protein